MSFWGRLFGSDNATDKVIDHVSNGMDKLVYTSEEKADDNAKSVTEARQMIIEWLKNTQGQNLARRLLALMIASVWLLQYISVQILSIIAVWSETPDNFLKSAQVIQDNIGQMTGAMMLLLGFYFAAPHMGGIVSAALNKFSNNSK